MIQSLLRNKEAVNFFCLNNPDLGRDTLSNSDWVEFESPVCILQPFLRSTLRLEGKAPNLWEVIPEIDYLSVFTAMLIGFYLCCLYKIVS